MAGQDELVRMMRLSAPETMPEAVLDHEGVRGVDIAPSEDGLEAGIAAIFESIRNGSGGEAEEHDGDSEHESDGDSAPDDDGVIFALLSELNRLWERAPV